MDLETSRARQLAPPHAEAIMRGDVKARDV